MGDSFTASVQYGDLRGTAAIDGYETGGPLRGLAEHTCLKSGYIPVGFGLTNLDPGDDGKVGFTLYAVQTEQVGKNVQEMSQYVSEHGKLPVVGFRGQIKAGTFVQHFKRFSLRVHSKTLALEPDQLDIVDYEYGEED